MCSTYSFAVVTQASDTKSDSPPLDAFATYCDRFRAQITEGIAFYADTVAARVPPPAATPLTPSKTTAGGARARGTPATATPVSALKATAGVARASGPPLLLKRARLMPCPASDAGDDDGDTEDRTSTPKKRTRLR